MPRGVYATRSYARQVYGMPPTRVDRWRTRNCQALGLAASACNTSGLEFMDGVDDPAVAEPVGQLRFRSEL